MKRHLALAAASMLALTTQAAVADGHSQALQSAMEARQAHMKLYAFYLGPLGAMAKGEVAYDAAAASAAAGNLAALTQLNQMTYWPPGSDSDSLEGSRALPAIWEPGSMAADKGAAMAEAAVALEAAAGEGLEALQAAMGPVGGACGDCHRSYRLRVN